jgi:ABC-type transport system substrate-binding protein
MGVGDREIIESIGGRMVQRQTTRVMYMTFTTEHVAETSPIQDPRVRRALNFAVNRDRISALLLDGRAKPMPQLALPGAPGHVAELEPFPYDPERAKALLAEAGYGEGLELSFRVAPAGADDMLVYQQIAENLRGIGVKFNILGTAVAQMTQMMFGGDFKAEMFNNFGRGLDPLGDYRYRSCLGQTGSYKPYYCDELALEFVRQAQQATSIAEVDRLMRAVTRREYEVPPGIFLWQAVMLDALGPRVSEAEKYGDYYEYIPYHAIALKDD